jgi:hypothetical protein
MATESMQIANLTFHSADISDRRATMGKLKVTIIDHNPKWDDKNRQERESFWIRKLKTLSPNGINEKK